MEYIHYFHLCELRIWMVSQNLGWELKVRVKVCKNCCTFKWYHSWSFNTSNQTLNPYDFLFFLFQEYLFSFLILNHKLEILHGHRTQVPSLLVLQLMGRHIFLIFTWTSILQSVVNKLCLEGHMGSWIISRLALVLRYWLLAIISKCKAFQDILLRVFLFSNFNLNIFNDFEH